jgi:hypothetical protein
MSKRIANPMKVITGPNTRWSYANVWEPKSINGGTPKYSVSLIIPKSDTATLTKIKAAIEAAYKEGEAKLRGNGKSVPALSAIKTPLRDGDVERPDDDAYKNAYFVNANATTAPGIVDADLNPILTRSEVYSGVYGRASASPSTRSTAPATRASPAGSTTCRRSVTASRSEERQVPSPISQPTMTRIS